MNAAAENVVEHSEPRVLIADDQNLVRTGFRMILREAGIPVVAEAADGGEAVAAALRDRPDVVLMDIRMPEMDGIEATRQIKRASPFTQVVTLTAAEQLMIHDAASVGAYAHLDKGRAPQLIRDVVLQAGRLKESLERHTAAEVEADAAD